MPLRVETAGRGVLLPDVRLALDTSAPGHASVVSHAHGDHIPWEATEAWCSAETAEVMALRAPHVRAHVLPWRAPARVGGATVTLHPAGHILGSACVHVEAPDGSTLLYTGDTKTRPGLTCPPAEHPQAETLVVESTFGLPIYRFPGLDALQEKAVRFARATLEQGATPVFLGYALGKAQELVAMLGRAGVPVVAHGAVWNVCQVYARHGVEFPNARPYVAGEAQGAALVVPDSFREHPMVLKLDHRLAYCSGWALLSKSRVQMDADLLLPLSDHADYPGLLEIVERVGPRRVLTNHGYADTLAHLLRKQGLDARELSVGHTDEDAGPAAGEAPA
ncbi:MAG TPA: MBL fold metallo-hydrolase [Candidatus Thermoplasmatota archaeon]|nr:MBL fold metallo-hydrolase [Candidatus Thermoplasmatota archaeon]